MIWHFENLLRARQERQAIEALAAQVAWLTTRGWRIDGSLRLILDADIGTSARSYPVSLRYPNHFPYSPPVVLPRDESGRWSGHQYGAGGELCLEHGTDNWHPTLTGADMLRSAHRLLEGEATVDGQRGVVASRHDTTVGQNWRFEYSRFLVTPEFVEMATSLQDGVVWEAQAFGNYHEESFVDIIGTVKLPSGEAWQEPNLPDVLRKELYERSVAIARWPEGLAPPPIEKLTSFRAAFVERGINLPAAPFVLLLRGAEMRSYLLGENSDRVWETSIILPPAPSPRLDADHTTLSKRRVAVIGCGSLGSKIAVMLARSGVGSFLLVDDDMLFPDNLVRHELDWREIATHKVDSVARRIQLVNPFAACEKRHHRLGGQESSGGLESLIETLTGCDLLIDATADPSVFNYLGAVVAIAKKPLAWAEVFGGGFGGLIARHRPGVEPEPASMRRAIEQWCINKGRPIQRAAARYDGGPTLPLIADDADVTVIASHCARLVIDTLIGRTPSLFPYSIYLVGLASAWIFDAPFDTYPIDVGAPSPLQPRQELTEAEAADERKRILQLLADYQDASSADSGSPQASSS
jgi:ThiF family protein